MKELNDWKVVDNCWCIGPELQMLLNLLLLKNINTY